MTLGGLAECWLDSNGITSLFLGPSHILSHLITTSTPASAEAAGTGQGRQLATGARRAHTVRGRIHSGWGQLKQVEEVTLDKDVLQMAIRSANICGSAVQMCPRVTH